MKRNKIASLLLGACLTFSTTSCNDWLDVIPQAQVSGDKIFSTTDGYESVLYGIYISMTEANTYGCNLTFGLMDVLAQYYTTYTNKSHLLYEASLYNYENDNTVKVHDYTSGRKDVSYYEIVVKDATKAEIIKAELDDRFLDEVCKKYRSKVKR